MKDSGHLGASGDGGAAVKAGNALGNGLAQVVVQNNIQLLLGNGVVGSKAPVSIATNQPLAGRPANRFCVPLSLWYVIKLHQIVDRRTAGLPPQDSGQHSPGQGTVRGKASAAHSGHQIIFPAPGNGLRIPGSSVNIGITGIRHRCAGRERHRKREKERG